MIDATSGLEGPTEQGGDRGRAQPADAVDKESRRSSREGPSYPIGRAFCELIRRKIESRGLTIKKLAGQVGVHDKFLATWEGDLVGSDELNVKLTTLFNIVRVLEFTPSDLASLPRKTRDVILRHRRDLGLEDSSEILAEYSSPILGQEARANQRDDGGPLEATPRVGAPPGAPAPVGKAETEIAHLDAPAKVALPESLCGDLVHSITDAEPAPTRPVAGAWPAWSLFVACLAYWLLGGVLPLATLAHGQEELLAREGALRLYMRVYAHLFLFPVTCGILLVALLIRPLSVLLGAPRLPACGAPDAVHSERWRRWAIALFVSWLLATLLVAVGDFFEGNHAIWEIAPRVLDRDPSLLKHFRAPNPEFREKFGLTIDRLVQDRSNWSWARWGYAFGLIPQIGALLAVSYMTIILVLRGPSGAPNDEGASEATRNLVLALFVGTFWLISRMAFLYEKDRLYLQPRNVGLDWINVLLFANAYSFATALVLRTQRPVRTALLSILALGGGLALFCRLSLFYSSWLTFVVGRNCSEFNFLYLLFFDVLVILCFFVPMNQGARVGGPN